MRLIVIVMYVCLFANFAHAQSYPAKPVRIIVPLAPGGGTDNITRIMQPKLAETLGQQVIVENRPGAGGQIGTEYVARAAPDGYTLLNVESSFASNPSIFKKLPYDTLKDFTPVSLLATAPNVLIIHPSVPAKNLKELIALGRSNPRLFTFAMGGLGTATHLGVEQFRNATKIDIVVVPYKSGGQATTSTLSGETAMLFGGTSSASGLVRAGKLRAIAVTGAQRNPSLPEVPTFAEAGMKEVDSVSVFGSVAPAATPKEIVATLNAAMKKTLQIPEVRKLLEARGYDIVGSTPEAYGANIRSEMARWEKVARETKLEKQ